LQRLNRLNEAIDSFNQAITLNQFFSEAYNNRGNTLVKLNKINEAISDYGEAININPNYADAYNNRAITFLESKKYNEALEDFEKVIILDSDFYHALGHLIHVKMNLCDWRNLENLKNEFLEKTRLNKPISPPFLSLSLIDSPQIQFDSARIYAQSLSIYSETKKIKKQNLKKKKIRIGYFSADFHDHATMHLIAEILELHDTEKFEIFGFSFGRYIEDLWSARARKSFMEFINVRNKSDKEIAQLSREMEIDIAIDLKGFTTDERAGIFIHRAAPIQINYLGYPGTMASLFIDYIIADKTIIPKDSIKNFSEKIIYLPGSYQPNISKFELSKKYFSRSDFGIPNKSFIFCAFNNNYKITPAIFDCWMDIMNSTDESVLWIYLNNKTAAKNLKNEAESKGINPNRIIFAFNMPKEEHLKRIQLADLFLDTFPYNAHTTASDALRVGLPILTIRGKSFASRVASSLLDEVDMPELISESMIEYRNKAIEIARDPEKLKKIKDKLLENVKNSYLFNSKLYTQRIEFAFNEIYRRHKNNLPADHIYIQDN
jgi:predicted O-linked N-acetylglucosamine transferase (SPINDLY family)